MKKLNPDTKNTKEILEYYRAKNGIFYLGTVFWFLSFFFILLSLIMYFEIDFAQVLKLYKSLANRYIPGFLIALNIPIFSWYFWLWNMNWVNKKLKTIKDEDVTMFLIICYLIFKYSFIFFLWFFDFYCMHFFIINLIKS